MNFLENFQTVIKSLKENKLRSTLTLLGIIFGVAAVITMVSMTDANKKWTMQELSSLGISNIDVWYDYSGANKKKKVKSKLITMKDIEVLRNKSFFITNAAPLMRTNLDVKYDTKTENFQIIGTTQEIRNIVDIKIEKGRYFVESDFKNKHTVCILGNEPKTRLFNNSDPINKNIVLQYYNKKIRFQVVGSLVEKKGWSSREINDSIIIPYTTMSTRLTGRKDFSAFKVQVNDAKNINYAETQIINIMKTRNIPISTWTPKDMIEMSLKFQKKLTIFGFFISGISLLIGGIGIMNIMLVSVMERIREIGIRRAVGASAKDIMRQFLTEAVFVGLVGGLMGVPLGIAGALAFGILFQFQDLMPLLYVISIPSIFVAFFFAAIVSAVFGYYPAKQAAKLDPIEALRYQ